MTNNTATIPVPLLDLKAQYATIRDEVRVAMENVVESQYFILGPEVSALEEEIASYSHCQYGVGVTSGTDALLVALMAIGIEPGDEVITTPYTFFSTAGSISRLNAKPVFADILPEGFNIDPAKIEACITPKTKAILPVHLYGQSSDMKPILDIAKRHKLIVIEDAAQAIGSEYRGQRAGSMGHLGCFSFFPSKNLGGFGDAGMVVSNDQQLAERVRLLRMHGSKPKYYHKIVGGNFRLDALQAAVLRVKLKHLDGWSAKRQTNADLYRELFQDTGLVFPIDRVEELDRTPGVILPADCGFGRHIYNQFVIRCHKRDALKAYLQENRIGSEIYYPVPLHLQECFADLGYREGELPVSECAAKQTLALPIYPELTEEMQRCVVQVIADFYRDEAGHS